MIRDASQAEGIELAQRMYARFGAEAQEAVNRSNAHADTIFKTGTVTGNTTSGEDMLVLYLLIRQFNRQSIFEIGTNIGCSAICMNTAARRNGGVLTTTDPIDYGYLPPWDGIRFIQGPGVLGLRTLQYENKAVDFCYIDWLPEEEAVFIARGLFTPDAILAVHDYGTDPKGTAVVDLLKRKYCAGRDGAWFYPAPERKLWPVTRGDGSRAALNSETAFFIPTSLL